jgi:hypothetical protein
MTAIQRLLSLAVRKRAEALPSTDIPIPKTLTRKEINQKAYATPEQHARSVVEANRYQQQVAANPKKYPAWNFYTKPLRYYSDKRPVMLTPVDNLPDNAYMNIQAPTSDEANIRLSPTAAFDYYNNPREFWAGAGHEAGHSVQPVGNNMQMAPVAFYAPMSKMSPRPANMSQPDHQRLMAMEMEATLKEYKARMYREGVDPYGPQAKAWLEKAITDNLAKGKGYYFQHVPAETIKAYIDDLAHIMRGVANKTDRRFSNYT